MLMPYYLLSYLVPLEEFMDVLAYEREKKKKKTTVEGESLMTFCLFLEENLMT